MEAWFKWAGANRHPDRLCGDAADALGVPVYVKGRDERSPWNDSLCHWPLPNVWLGVSVEDQQRADERIPHLRETPAAVRFLSVEPMLGPVDISEYLDPAAAVRRDVGGRRLGDRRRRERARRAADGGRVGSGAP